VTRDPRRYPTRSNQRNLRLVRIRAGLLLPCSLGIPGDRAGGIRRGDNGSRQAQGCERCKDQAFHRNSPSIVGRDVRLRWIETWARPPAKIIWFFGIGFMREMGKFGIRKQTAEVPMVCVTRAYRLGWLFAASQLVQVKDWWAGRI
jgi:hypothetical protein